MTSILSQLVYYFPHYVALVLAPMALRILAEAVIGIRPDLFDKVHSALPLRNMAYEQAFRTVVLSALYYPLFEELVFRGLPYYFFGTVGVVVGSTVWVLMHPSWQLQYLTAYPLRKKIAFTVTSTLYYTANAIFYSTIWLDGAGLVAIIYHMGHNFWLTLLDIFREELPIPKFRYSKKEKEAPISIKPMKISPRGIKLPRATKSKEEPKEHEMHFVVRKSTGSLVREVDNVRSMMYVHRKKT